MLKILTIVSICGLNSKGIASVAWVTSRRGVTAILTNSLGSIGHLWKSSTWTGQHAITR